MNFFGIGPMELILVMVLALIVFGPGKMPEIGRAVGSAIREFRRASQELTSEIQREVDLSQIKEEVKAIQSEVAQAVPYQAGAVTVELDEPVKKAPDTATEPRRAEAPDQETPPQLTEGPELTAEPEAHPEGTPTSSASIPKKSAVQRRVAQRGVARRRDQQS